MSDRDSNTIRDLGFRNKSMKERYDNVRPSFVDVARWIDPARGRHLGMGDNADRVKQISLIDSTPRRAYRTLKAGLMSGLSSPSRPWFKLKLQNAADNDRPEVQAWLSECQRRLYEVLTASNAYNALMQCYGDLGLFGVYGGVVRFSPDNIIHVQSFPVGSFLIAEDEEGRVDTLHWQLKMTVRQLVEKFGVENVSHRVKNLWERNALNDRIEVMAAIEPRFTKDPMAWRAQDMPNAVYYWEANEKGKLLHEGGLEFRGILGPRWETVTDDPWPISSPARDALGDVRQLQTKHKDMDSAIQMSYMPPVYGPADAANFSYIAGAYNPVPIGQMGNGPKPIFNPSMLNIAPLDASIERTQRRVDEAFYASLFTMVSEYGIQGAKDVTATAIASMQEEKLVTLGPVLESIDRGLLSPLIEATFHYAQEAEILPPAPDNIVGGAVAVQFTSLLAQAQRAIGVAAIERVVGFAGTLAQMGITGPLEVLDGDGLMRDFADQVGFPMDKLRSAEDVEAEREARAQQAQQQQMMEAAPQMAQAANLISEANARGQEALAAQGLV